MKKKHFDIDRFMAIIGDHYTRWDVPVVSVIANRGGTPFEILVSTVLSLRTKDEVTSAASARLFAVSRTPEEMWSLTEEKLKTLIYPVGFYHTKAARIREISRLILDRFHGKVPDTIDQLLTLPGVGRKTANLVLIEGFHKDAICVDTHVHRISNRVGIVQTSSPDKTEFALREKLPRKYWIRYNEMLVAFGQAICRPVSPFCSRCPVYAMCPQIGVDRFR
jgi:endonuclease-3